ncbi:hypothetical protein A2U01_0024878 [Trifolium medium]|uniref:Uncharacterized protein n=1 Tax=Trifolium medium TaxID=97028 RepID=A0A392NVJ4_9FABA|nr:hypothetical protein [Trifolium medium]
MSMEERRSGSNKLNYQPPNFNKGNGKRNCRITEREARSESAIAEDEGKRSGERDK